ncbi:hypothetical protein ACQEVX_33900 [Streptomyces syringium]|uniref:hypothetical protein n=1 Tax=Streptomyces syringium TaxID=76729 RepID=UPI003D911E71
MNCPHTPDGAGRVASVGAPFAPVVDGEVLPDVPWRALAAAGGRSHLFEVCRPSPARGGALGASQSVDVPLLLGTFDSPAGRILIGGGESPAEALALAEEIRGAWAAFAGHGDPGWPRHGADRRLTRLLDAEVRTARYPEERSRRIWHGHAFDPFDLT